MNPIIIILLDVLMLVLLMGTIVSAWRLQSRFKVLKDVHKDFEKLMLQFDESTRRADQGIKTLHRTAEQAGSVLQTQIDRAQSLYDDLSTMAGAAENVARRLDQASASLSQQRSSSAQSAAVSRAESAAAEPIPPDPRSRAERELLQALNKKE